MNSTASQDLKAGNALDGKVETPGARGQAGCQDLKAGNALDGKVETPEARGQAECVGSLCNWER